jgi:hypothetical protein
MKLLAFSKPTNEGTKIMNRFFLLAVAIMYSVTAYARADNFLNVNGYRSVVNVQDDFGSFVFGWSSNNLTTFAAGYSYETTNSVASQIVELSLAGVPDFDPRLARLEVKGQIRFTDHQPGFELLSTGNALLDVVSLWNEAANSYVPDPLCENPFYHCSGRPSLIPFVVTVVNLLPYVVRDPNTGNMQLDMPVDYFDGDGFVNFESGSLLSYRLYMVPQITNSQPYHVLYTGSGTPPWNRLDTSKTLVKEGAGPKPLSYDNLINTSQGITGIVFDIENLPGSANLSVEDFEFQMSPTGAFNEEENSPSKWQSAPAPSSISVTAGSPARILIEWQAGSIMNRWLRITVQANSVTGLEEPEVYYLGHLLGETTGPQNGVFTVSFADITPIRTEVGQTVDASSIADIDKNGTVSFADISAMRGNVGAQLKRVTVP